MRSIIESMSVLCIASLGLTNCTSAPPFVPEATTDNTTAEGLVRVENSRFDEVYVRPGFDLTEFDSVILAPVSVSYKSRRPDNELNNRQLDLMKRYFTEEIEAAFTESGHFRLVDTAGANTMSVHAQITDLEINVPTETNAIHRNRVFVASSGQMNLVAEVHNSQSSEILVRIEDRRQARDYWHEVTTISEWAEVRSAFRYWSRIAKERIDAVYANKM